MVLLQHIEGEFDLIRRREIKLRPDGESGSRRIGGDEVL